jgi:transposase
MTSSNKTDIIKKSNVNFALLAKKEKRGRVRIRFLALAHLKRGSSYRRTAKMLDVSPVSIGNWINRFVNSGLDGLQDQTFNSGRRQMLPKNKEEELKRLVLEEQKKLRGGRLIGADIIEFIKKKYGISYSSAGFYHLMDRIGLVWISSRSQHPKASKKKRANSKKTFPKRSKNLSQRMSM